MESVAGSRWRAHYIAQRKFEAQIGQAARDRFNTEADLRTSELLALRKMLPLAPTAAEIDRFSREFARYLRDPNAEREPADIFDDEIAPIDADPAVGTSGPAVPPQKPGARPSDEPDQPTDYGDFME